MKMPTSIISRATSTHTFPDFHGEAVTKMACMMYATLL